MNQAEIEFLAGQFAAAGHEIVENPEEAELYILNTCTVTKTADAKSRHLLRQVHRANPGAVLVATGCYAERAPDDLRGIDGVRVVAGNRNKLILPGYLAVTGVMEKGGHDGNPNYLSRTRSFVRIQDGCSRFCTFCIVPFVRPFETSVPAPQVIDYVNQKAAAGVKEIVLTGTEPGSYRDGATGITALLARLLRETAIERLRVSSLQPHEITPELVSIWSNRRMCPHFHLSLQSGSDAVLKKMNRRYTTDDFLKAVSLIRSAVPDVAVTTDIIAGFPGETDEDFRKSLELCRNIGFARVHVFPYSKRPGTAAAAISGQVEDSIRTQRSQNLGLAAAECAETFRNKLKGRITDVLWEQKSGSLWSGYTGNYVRVYVKSNTDLANRITPVKLGTLFRDGLKGELFP